MPRYGRRKSSQTQKEKQKEKYYLQKELICPTEWKNLPEDWYAFEGFIYLIENLKSHKKYIGLKYFWVRQKTKIVKESNWATYKSSCLPLLRDIKLLGKDNFSFTILSVHRTFQELHLAEVEAQFKHDVLKEVFPNGEPAWYNDNIANKFFRPKDFGTEEYYKKCNQISKRLKEGYSSGRIVHALLGKTHPNKGKKLPQTGHQKNKGKIWITNGIENKLISAKDSIPDNFYLGLSIKKKRPKKEKIKKKLNCPVCNKEFVPSGTQKYCSQEHTNEAKKERARKRYKNKTQTKGMV